MKTNKVLNWESDSGVDLLSYDAENQKFNVKAGRIKPAEARELIHALTEALAAHDAAVAVASSAAVSKERID